MTTNMTNRIKTERVHKGLTQEELAKVLNVSRGSIALWETGKNGASMVVLSNMADLFGCSADWLLGRSDNRTGK